MLWPVAERAVRQDLMVGSGIGALNGGAVRSRPDGRRRAAPGTRLDPPALPQVFAGSIFGRLSTRARRGTYPHPNAARRAGIEAALPGACI
jgi:NTE family protein